VAYKNKIAKIIMKEISNKSDILSIGCGLGIVEKYLVKHMPNINLTAIEPSLNAIKWIKHYRRINIKNGYFPEVLDSKIKFETGYANCVDYVFNNEEYDAFLKSVVQYGIKEFLIISVSYYFPSFKIYIKEIFKNFFIKMRLYKQYQFFGYQRSIKEQFDALQKAGFKNFFLIYKFDSTIIIKAIV